MDENDGVTRRGLLTAGAGVALATAMPLEGRAASPREAAAAMMADPAAAVSSGQMWEQFCDALKPLGQRVGAEHTHGDFLTQVEGIRCLSRLVALGLDRFLEYADPRHPDFYELQTPTRKYLGDNPDQTYRVATVDGKGSYRARDSAAGAAGVEVGVYAGTFRSDGVGGARRLVASRDETTLEIADDGSFEFTLGPNDGNGNHLKTAPDASSLLIRTYFWDRDLRRAHALPRIERLDVSTKPEPLNPETLLHGLLGTAAFVDGSLDWWNRFQGIQTAPNELIVMPDDGTVQTPSQVRYINGIVDLERDQALVLDFTPKDEPGYWSWVLQNLWGETPDWRYHPIVRNNRELERGVNGSVQIVISHRDPGVANWMDMAGHRRLLLSLRWRGETALPDVKARVAPLSEFA